MLIHCYKMTHSHNHIPPVTPNSNIQQPSICQIKKKKSNSIKQWELPFLATCSFEFTQLLRIIHPKMLEKTCLQKVFYTRS